MKGCDSGFFSCDEIDYIEWNGVLEFWVRIN